MTRTRHGLFLLFVSALLIAGLCVEGQAKKRKRNRKVVTPVEESEPLADDSTEQVESEIRLKLSDGTSMRVDDAWETEQGIWYKQAGITHLASRDRVKGIQRSTVPRVQATPQVAVVKEMTTVRVESSDGPAWIYLVGGAKVEADSATQSAAGVWYKRGPLSIFIERSRVDHIEREVETVASSDSGRERGWSTGNQRLDGLIRQNASKYGVDSYLIFLVMEQESHFNSRAVSPKGARGLMQLMPGTAARFGVRRPHDPAQNIAGGTRYLKQLMNQFNGRVDLVLASYNAGEGAVMKFGNRVPPYKETRNYVKRIGYKYRRAKTPAPAAKNGPAAGGN